MVSIVYPQWNGGVKALWITSQDIPLSTNIGAVFWNSYLFSCVNYIKCCLVAEMGTIAFQGYFAKIQRLRLITLLSSILTWRDIFDAVLSNSVKLVDVEV